MSTMATLSLCSTRVKHVVPAAQTKPVQPAKPADASSSASAAIGGDVIGNKNSKKYHLQGCPGYNQVGEKNRVFFKSAAEAEAAGYTKAGNCKKE